MWRTMFFVSGLSLVSLHAQAFWFSDKKAGLPDQAQSCFTQAGQLPVYMIAGKGIDTDRHRARAKALQEIANQYQVEVTSRVSNQVSSHNDAITDRYDSYVRIASTAQIENARLKCEYLAAEDGIHYQLYLYDTRPSHLQMAERLLSLWGGEKPQRIDWMGYGLVLRSHAITQMTQLLTDVDAPESSVRKVRVYLDHRADGWSVSMNQISQNLHSESVADYLAFDELADAKRLSIEVLREAQWQPVEQLHAQEEFRLQFSLAPQTYYQVFNIYQDGRVASLGPQARMLHEEQTLPHQGVYAAGLLVPGEATLDTYLLVYSTRPFRPPNFQTLEAWQGPVEGEQAYQLDKVLHWLDSEESLSTAALTVLTLPR